MINHDRCRTPNMERKQLAIIYFVDKKQTNNSLFEVIK